MKRFGLIGKDVSYSFSPDYFNQKFQRESLVDYNYQIFDLPEIQDFKEISKLDNLVGCNVTIPYKVSIIPYLDELSKAAKAIGAVNTIHFLENKKIGYNTDFIGFKDSLIKLLKPHHNRALILGNGGASKAVQYAFKTLNIPFTLVGRKKTDQQITYDSLTPEIIKNHSIIVNTTPLGSKNHISESPDLPYNTLNSSHLVYDLIYNPEKTVFLQLAENQGATIKNGLEMLELQAEASWKIWNNQPF